MNDTVNAQGAGSESRPGGPIKACCRMVGVLYRSEQNIDFAGLWRKALIGSLLLIGLSFVGFGFRGLDLGIEFEGGTAWEVAAPDMSVAQARDALRATAAADARIQIVGGDSLRVRDDTQDTADVDEVRSTLVELLGVSIDDVSVTTVGPSWGAEITDKAVRALLVFFVLVAIYIAVRLEWKMAAGALVAVVHDIIISVGFYSLFQFEITPATVIAFLTIMGYSLYDTIVVFDKVREVVGQLTATGRHTYTEMMNISLNRVLMRSVNTSITSALPVASMLVIGSFLLGALPLQEFAIALLVGIIVGTYSSLFVASSLVAWLKEREPDNLATAHRVRLRRGNEATVEHRTSTARTTTNVASPVATRSHAQPSVTVPPRPRKKRKKR